MLYLYRLSLVLEQDRLGLSILFLLLLILDTYLREGAALAQRLFLTVICLNYLNNTLLLGDTGCLSQISWNLVKLLLLTDHNMIILLVTIHLV